MMTCKISIVIPAYNEEKNIVAGLKEINKTLSKKNYEVLVVDDGSTDRTAEKVEKADFNRVKLIKFKKNRGKGAAVKKGVMEASGDFILFTDADQSTSIDHIFSFLREIKNYDIVIGSRTLPESKLIKKQPLYKRILGKIGNLFIRLMLDIPYQDTQCGFKLFRREAAEKIFKEVTFSGWSFDFEVLKIAQNKKLKTKELPVAWKNDPNTAIGLTDYFKTLKDLFLIRKKYDD